MYKVCICEIYQYFKIILLGTNNRNDAIPHPNHIHMWKIRRARYTNASSVAEK